MLLGGDLTKNLSSSTCSRSTLASVSRSTLAGVDRVKHGKSDVFLKKLNWHHARLADRNISGKKPVKIHRGANVDGRASLVHVQGNLLD